MLVQCEPIVSDTGPTFYKHWVNVSRLLGCVILLPSRTSGSSFVGGTYDIKGSGTALNQCSHREHVFAGFYLLISLSLIPYTSGAFSQRWRNVLKKDISNATITKQTSGVHTISVTDRHLVTVTDPSSGIRNTALSHRCWLYH